MNQGSRIDNTRDIKAPRGTTLNAKSWLTEAPLRMLMNNLDPEVAERPEDLVVYGGTGRAARTWEDFDNIIKALKKLENNQVSIGTWQQISNASISEILGQAGFDWLLVDGEHSANDFKDFMHQLMALKDSASAPIVRPQWSEPVIVKRLMDLGFYNFLFPFIETEEQAKAMVAATRYPPDGMRGVALMQRGNKFGYITDYPEKINQNVGVLVQIESLEGGGFSLSGMMSSAALC